MDFGAFLNDKGKSRVLAKVLAHLMGDGCVTERYLRYLNKNQSLLDDFKKDFESLFKGTHFITGTCNSGTPFLQVQKKDIIEYLLNLCKSFKSKDLTFPLFLKNIENKKAFIGAIFDDEGCVALRTFQKTKEIKRNLDISSKSPTFLEEIKEILENELNIKCNKIIHSNRNLNGKTFTTYKLSITGRQNIENFKEQIKVTHPEKIRKLDLMISSYIFPKKY